MGSEMCIRDRSSATLPVTMRCLQDKAGVSKRTSSFVLPLGATVNMDGTALYECIAVLFVAQVMGASLDFAAQLSVVVLALLTSVGVAGVPSASLVAIVIIIQNVAEDQDWGGGAMAAVGAIYAVDRILDMCRTSVNIFSDSCGAVIIARSEGEQGVLQEMKKAPPQWPRRKNDSAFFSVALASCSTVVPLRAAMNSPVWMVWEGSQRFPR